MRPVCLVLLAAALVTVVGCGDDDNAITRNTVDYYREVIVLPSGSIAGARYWRIIGKGLVRTQQIAGSDIPFGAKVTTIVTVTAAPSSNPGLLAASAAAPETTIVALFTGGFEPASLTSARAALAVAGEDLDTNLAMTARRTEHAMATLPDGRVLITGGYSTGSPPVATRSAEIFTLGTMAFTATGDMLTPRADHAVATLLDGRVLVTGGLVPDGGGPATIDVASSEIWSNGNFSAGPDLHERRFNHSAVTLDDGRVLVVGGNARLFAEIYSPATNEFTQTASMSVLHGQGHVAVKLRNGKVLVVGGDLGNLNPTAVVELFDPASNTFTVVGNMSTPRMQHFAVLLDDGTVMIGGGRGTGGGGLDSVELYDPATNAFTPLPDLPDETYDAAVAHVQGRARN